MKFDDIEKRANLLLTEIEKGLKANPSAGADAMVKAALVTYIAALQLQMQDLTEAMQLVGEAIKVLDMTQRAGPLLKDPPLFGSKN